MSHLNVTDTHEPLPIASAVLYRYLAGGAGTDEIAVVERWLANNPAHREELERLRRAWAMAGTSAPVWDTKALWNTIADRLAAGGVAQPPNDPQHDSDFGGAVLHVGTRPNMDGASGQRRTHLRLHRGTGRPRNAIRRAVMASAAAILVAFSAAYFVQYRGAAPRTALVPEATREVRTGSGERAEIVLGDGTKIILGVASRIRIPHTFDRARREVHLDGEAYFEVARDPKRAFVVRSSNTATTVLGTRFGVRAYATDSAVRIVVVEGRVGVVGDAPGPPSGAGMAGEVLSRNDLALVSRRGRTTRRRNVDPERYLAWTRGVVRFDNATLRDAIPELQRQYGLELHVADESFAERRFTASFSDRNVDEALRGLAFLLDARVERNGDEVKLYPRAR